MEKIEVGATVKLISLERTDKLGFRLSMLEKMLGHLFTINCIDRFGSDKMFQINGIWVAQKDCLVYEEDTVESVKPPTLIFDVNNLIVAP